MHVTARVLWSIVLLCALIAPALNTAPAARAQASRPLIAFYYPWYEPSDWSRSRMSDLPVIKYSGGDDATLRRHIQQATDAGIK